MTTWESNSHVTDYVTVTMINQRRDPSMLGVQYLENGWW